MPVSADNLEANFLIQREAAVIDYHAANVNEPALTPLKAADREF